MFSGGNSLAEALSVFLISFIYRMPLRMCAYTRICTGDVKKVYVKNSGIGI